MLLEFKKKRKPNTQISKEFQVYKNLCFSKSNVVQLFFFQFLSTFINTGFGVYLYLISNIFY